MRTHARSLTLAVLTRADGELPGEILNL